MSTDVARLVALVAAVIVAFAALQFSDNQGWTGLFGLLGSLSLAGGVFLGGAWLLGGL